MTDSVLILGGTEQARALAASLDSNPNFEVVYSLAGVTGNPTLGAGTVRRGGFGGAAGLARFMTDQSINTLVDATHPFAATMTGNALKACAMTGIRHVIFSRPAWTASNEDEWISVPDVSTAADQFLFHGQRGFLTIGSRELEPFVRLASGWFLVRTIERPQAELSSERFCITQARGPFNLDAEIVLLKEHKIDCVVTKNSGGDATRAKLDAARELGLPVLVCERPALPGGLTLTTLPAVLEWLERP
jgi:precorrin-6A/cobalt-precorrin-6A reductase